MDLLLALLQWLGDRLEWIVAVAVLALVISACIVAFG